jgi:DNA polymerase-1
MADKKTNKQKIVLLDAHAILHRAYHALPDFASSKGEPTGALFGLSTMLFSIINELKPDHIIACFDLPKPTYRHEVYADYKAGRKETDSELKKQFNRARDMFKVFSIPIYEQEGFEADDILGTIVEKTKNDKNIEIIIASGDMDTLQLVDGKKVQVYTLKKGIKDTILYDEKAVKARFGFNPEQLTDYKGLRGDPSDNIIGVAGIGDKTATSLISAFKTIENIYKNIDKDEKFEKAGIKPRIQNLLKENQEEAEFSKMLATIRRDAPISFEVPEKTWRDSIDEKRVKDLFRELDFRTLVSRFDSVLGIESDDLEEEKKEELKKVDQSLLKEAAVALWVLDSNLTNPTVEDIVAYTKVKNSDELDKARDILLKEIEKKNLDFIYNKIEKPLIPVIKQMEDNGVKVDVSKLKTLSKEYHKELDSIEKDIYKQAGEEFNINSPKQLAEILFEKMELTYKGMRKTSTGKYSTKEEVLHKLDAEGHKIASKILEYREFQKLLSTYIDNLPSNVEKDGRLRATFLQTGTTTGRLSSNNPNLQNIPVGSDKGRAIREAFVCEEGNVLVSFDYSQIELRIAAFLSGDEKMINAFKNGEDIHTAVASEVFNIDPSKVEKEQRRQAKVINFGILYGMGVTALQKNLGTDRKTAQEFYNKYFESYTGFAAYIDKIKKDTKLKGYTETLFGRRRYFEGFNSPLPFIRAQAERMAINAPIQGTEADLVKLAMVKIDDFLNTEGLKDKVKLILQVHDEVIYEVLESVLEKNNLKEKIIEIMENLLTLEKTSGVPIIAECEVGYNWGELK